MQYIFVKSEIGSNLKSEIITTMNVHKILATIYITSPAQLGFNPVLRIANTFRVSLSSAARSSEPLLFPYCKILKRYNPNKFIDDLINN